MNKLPWTKPPLVIWDETSLTCLLKKKGRKYVLYQRKHKCLWCNLMLFRRSGVTMCSHSSRLKIQSRFLSWPLNQSPHGFKFPHKTNIWVILYFWQLSVTSWWQQMPHLFLRRLLAAWASEAVPARGHTPVLNKRGYQTTCVFEEYQPNTSRSALSSVWVPLGINNGFSFNLVWWRPRPLPGVRWFLHLCSFQFRYWRRLVKQTGHCVREHSW